MRGLLVGLVVAGAGCSHVRSRLEVAVATDEGTAVCPVGDDCGGHAKVCKNPTVHALACDLDHLEKHIECYGSVVAKVPDVWGQARLTQYREEFEQQMKADLTAFAPLLNGSLSRTDQSFFAFSAALSAAAGGGSPTLPSYVSFAAATETAAKSPAPAADKKTTAETTAVAFADADPPADDKKPKPDEKPKPADAKKDPPAKDSGATPKEDKKDAPADPTATVKQASLTTFGIDPKGTAIGLEPTEQLAQKKRYLDYLNQLRRTNEGDDTADAPGYALNLMRVPVSVFPGKHTDVGYGAEITLSLEPVLGDDLLPMTYRNLVQNDLRHQLGVPLTQFLNDRAEAERDLSSEAKLQVEGLPLFNAVRDLVRLLDPSNEATKPPLLNFLRGLPADDRQRVFAVAKLAGRPEEEGAKNLVVELIENLFKDADAGGSTLTYTASAYKSTSATPRSVPAGDKVPNANPQDVPKATQSDAAWGNTKLFQKLQMTLEAEPAGGVKSLTVTTSPPAGGANPPAAPNPSPDPDPTATRAKAIIDPNLQRLRTAAVRLPVPSLSYSPGLVNKTGFPTSQLFDVYGLIECYEIAYAANEALKPSIDRQKYTHLPDVQAFLQQETFAAYRFLREPECQTLWDQFCTPTLVTAVRTRRLGDLQTLREAFRQEIDRITHSTADRQQRPYNLPGRYSVTAALAWCYLVDSALLTDRLMQDMRESATARGKPCPGNGAWLPYYLPNPPPEAKAAFAEYVRTRWPIYVFALDPEVQEQNIADTLTTTRELQLALSVAFTQGQIGAKALTQYARKLQAEYETIAVNRTQVGFGHGESTFGWRFYPRYQTPDTPGALRAFSQTLTGRPNRNQLLRQRRLEPGPRDCVALVIMPSFVPCVTVDTVSNWFGLANPKHKVLDHTQAMHLSKTVHTLERCGPGVADSDCYRDGEVRRLNKRVEQLANRLPAQTLSVPVPIINTLGGFEMFSNGTTDLAPELFGWYGAPGVMIGANANPTTLFLVGDHFSPLKSRVVVGNAAVTNGDTVPGALVPSGAKPPLTPPNQRMLSRQVMEVTIDGSKAAWLLDKKTGKKYVQAHVATPYGVSRELLIPVVGGEAPDAPKPADPPAEGYRLPDGKYPVSYRLKRDGDKPSVDLAKPMPELLVVVVTDHSGSVPQPATVWFQAKVGGDMWTGSAPAPAGAKNTLVVSAAYMKTVMDSLLKKVSEQPEAADQTQAKTLLDAVADSLTVMVQPDAGKPVVHATWPVPTLNRLQLVFEAGAADKPAKD